MLEKILPRLRPKLSLIFEVTNACNLRCPFCYVIREDRLQKEFISLEVYEQVLKIYRPLYLQLTGGEATIHPQFLELLKLAAKYVLKMQVSTNGVLIHKFLQEIRNLPKQPVIGLSLDAPSEAHDAIRNRPGLFNRIHKTIQLLKLNKIPHALAMTVFGKGDLPNFPEGNLNLVEKMLKFCEDQQLYVNIQPYSPAQTETRVSLGKILLKSKSRHIINSIPYRQLLTTGNWFHTQKSSQCRYLWTNISINAKGRQLRTQPRDCYFCSDCTKCYYSCVWEPSLITSRAILPTVRSFLRQGLALDVL
jgi:MoaA/NifB/PqqE/SkfB family radical SAM enzyme